LILFLGSFKQLDFARAGFLVESTMLLTQYTLCALNSGVCRFYDVVDSTYSSEQRIFTEFEDVSSLRRRRLDTLLNSAYILPGCVMVRFSQVAFLVQSTTS
jgi:hypothetical protein